MANHVSNYIQLHGNQAAQDEFKRVFASISDSEHQSLFDLDFLPRLAETGNVSMDHIGAKWAYVEDAEDEYASVVSAWSPVLPFIEELGQHLTLFDEDVKITCQFEDESYNFVGIGLYEDGEVIQCSEDFDELVEARLIVLEEKGEEVPEDAEDYDPWEDDDWHDFVNDRQHAMEVDLMESC